MGNACTDERQRQFDEYKSKGKDQFKIIHTAAKAKYVEAQPHLNKAMEKGKEVGGKALQRGGEQYDLAKLRMLNFKPPFYVDDTELRDFTKFEFDKIIHVFGKMSVLEFERRLKKLITEENADRITEAQVIEVFADHKYFKELTEPGSFLRAFLFDPIFKKNKSEDDYFIPYYMLMGLMYCASNP